MACQGRNTCHARPGHRSLHGNRRLTHGKVSPVLRQHLEQRLLFPLAPRQYCASISTVIWLCSVHLERTHIGRVLQAAYTSGPATAIHPGKAPVVMELIPQPGMHVLSPLCIPHPRRLPSDGLHHQPRIIILGRRTDRCPARSLFRRHSVVVATSHRPRPEVAPRIAPELLYCLFQ